ncbi:hypothetical protein DCS_01197 [Drechmeria coniospora]|uniref:Uncharacterized protein n=1 Tax=Drechmeria coniospora TaxID=98403 RepID=A0A151GSM3_DRECN|nr:hypothetical protein DCS_01197 [Drechmeria coniospora]KYK60063.1 hypothetical protein DCS_01197 [Drechmeria coniospora]
MKATQISSLVALCIVSVTPALGWHHDSDPPPTQPPANVDAQQWCKDNIDVPGRCESGRTSSCEDVCKACSDGKEPIKQGKCDWRGLFADFFQGHKCVCRSGPNPNRLVWHNLHGEHVADDLDAMNTN